MSDNKSRRRRAIKSIDGASNSGLILDDKGGREGESWNCDISIAGALERELESGTLIVAEE